MNNFYHNSTSKFLPLDVNLKNLFLTDENFKNFNDKYIKLENTNNIESIREINELANFLLKNRYYEHARVCYEKSLALNKDQVDVLISYVVILDQQIENLKSSKIDFYFQSEDDYFKESLLDKTDFLYMPSLTNRDLLIEHNEIIILRIYRTIEKIISIALNMEINLVDYLNKVN